MNKVAVIGLGLIGGSLALDIKEVFGCIVIGIDRNSENVQKALDLGFIDEVSSIEKLTDVNVVIIATPVDTVSEIASQVLDIVSNDTLVFNSSSIQSFDTA